MTKKTPISGSGDKVGRGHPPVEHQFKKGVSGNPFGRPKNRHRFLTQLFDELMKPIPLPTGGEVGLPKMMCSSLVAQISRGKHTRPIELTLQILEKGESLHFEAEAEQEIDGSKRERLDDALERIAKKRRGQSGEDPEPGC